MSSYAQRYAQSQDRSSDRRSGLADFAEQCGFVLDDFQVDACRAVAKGLNVVVSAPTGSGKTVVAEFAAHLCREAGKRLFYTTPIKALSNQKFHELREAHSENAVGLLTGDNSVNPDAELVVMTTEVLRNMIYSDSNELIDLSVVVMDEVHYLADKSRGPVWEETLIHLPAHVQVIALSATVSNADEFSSWISHIRGATETVVEKHRPVPLHQHVFHEGRLIDLLNPAGQLNPELVTLHKRLREQQGPSHGNQRSAHRRHWQSGRPSRAEIVDTLADAGLSPAIVFIFSRNGCDSAVEQCLDARVPLTSATERLEIREIIEERCRNIPDGDLAVLGYLRWREALENGLAAHHAGLIPVFKETIEALFQRGLIKLVFATETLALGINMPAKSVLIERMVKWNGDAHVQLNPAEFTQLTGRAGRRGIDDEGHAVVVMSADLDLQTLAATATTPSFPLRSAFTASYNMVVNLIGTYGFEEARRFNSLSFAQFQSDLSQKGLSAAIAKNTESQQEFAQDLACHLGDFDAYAQLAADLSKAEKAANAESRTAANSAINAALEQLRTGDVIEVNRGRRRGRALVIAPAVAWPPRIAVLSIDRQVRRVAVGDFAAPPRVLAHIRIREGFNERSTNARKSLAAELATIAVDEQTSPAESTYTIDSSEDAISRMRSALRSHACHGCADRAVHMSAWHAHQRLSKESSVLSAKIAGRQSALTRRFDALCRVLGELGYMDATSELQLLPPGALLAGIHTELDLVTAEVVQQGIFDEVTPAVAAAMGAALTYESRGDEQKPVIMPTDEIRHVLTTIHRAWAKVTEIEGNHQVRQTRPLDFSMVPAMYRWARGGTLANVLHDQEFSAGDFVRACRQCIDLLRHIATSDGVSVATRNAVRGAIHAIDRDLVNASVADQ